MAIIKSVKGIGKTHLSLQKLIDYVGKKAEQTKGINCSDNYLDVAQEFKATKEFYNKLDERQYKHIVQSFKHGEITSEKATEIGLEFCEKSFKGYEIFIATHTDKEHIHNHIILNSVNLETGLKYQEKNKDLSNLKKINNEICKSHGLSIPQNSKEKGKIIAWDKKKYVSLKKGIGDKKNDSLNLVNLILKAKQKSISKDNFIDIMKKNGIETTWTNTNKNVTFELNENQLNGKKNKFRLETLGKTFNLSEFSKEGLENEFIRNAERELGGREQAPERSIEKLSEHKQNTRFTTSVDERGLSNNTEQFGKSIRQSIGLGRVDSIDDKRTERALQRETDRLEQEARRELERLERDRKIEIERLRIETERLKQEKLTEINRRKSKYHSRDDDMDIGY